MERVMLGDILWLLAVWAALSVAVAAGWSRFRRADREYDAESNRPTQAIPCRPSDMGLQTWPQP